MRVEFYYSTKDASGSQYTCNNANALELLKKLEAKGTIVKVTDMASLTGSIFMTYNAAVTGPKSSIRPVFGTKGALEQEFGKAVPALLVFNDDNGRYPDEVFPRMDRDLNRLLGIEETVQNLISK